jgi:hypothetical protein
MCRKLGITARLRKASSMKERDTEKALKDIVGSNIEA